MKNTGPLNVFWMMIFVVSLFIIKTRLLEKMEIDSKENLDENFMNFSLNVFIKIGK